MDPKIPKVRKTPYKPWTEDAERFVLYADIMGFTDRVMRSKHDVLRKGFMGFRKRLERQNSPLFKDGLLKLVQFSDSFLIVAKGNDYKMFNLLTKSAARLMHVALELGFPIKGAIAQGTFTFDSESQLYFGRPLVDAAILHDQLKFYGIAVHHSAEKLVKQFTSADNPYYLSPIALRTGWVSHYHLAWHLLGKDLDSKDNKEESKGWLQGIAESVSGDPRIYIDNTLRMMDNDVFKGQGDENKEMEGK